MVGPTFDIYKNTDLTIPDYAYNKSAALGYTKYMSARYAKNLIRFNAGPAVFIRLRILRFKTIFIKSTISSNGRTR